METLLKHKGFIEMVARDIIRPDESQQIVKDVLEAYSKIDSSAEILVGCSTCENKFKDTFKIILAYINELERPKINLTDAKIKAKK
jgi:trimethylamine:corrinoid methyltransferase-like protein